jgi:Xaa-Pro aminopeptidase
MQYYPHSVGHWLGLDTHDASSVPHDAPLEAGVVLTIEPGLYLPAGPHVPPEFAGIGIRIEDDVLIRAVPLAWWRAYEYCWHRGACGLSRW